MKQDDDINDRVALGGWSINEFEAERKERTMMNVEDLSEAEKAFAEAVAADFGKLQTADGPFNENIDRFYGVRFMALFAIMDAYLQKGGVPLPKRRVGLEKVFTLALHSFNAVKRETVDKQDKPDGN